MTINQMIKREKNDFITKIKYHNAQINISK